jgi:hypothetical protein
LKERSENRILLLDGTKSGANKSKESSAVRDFNPDQIAKVKKKGSGLG